MSASGSSPEPILHLQQLTTCMIIFPHSQLILTSHNIQEFRDVIMCCWVNNSSAVLQNVGKSLASDAS